MTMLQRDGHPTALGEAIASYGRIFKSLHILSYIDVDESYRRDIKGIRNLQEGRHALARVQLALLAVADLRCGRHWPRWSRTACSRGPPGSFGTSETTSLTTPR